MNWLQAYKRYISDIFCLKVINNNNLIISGLADSTIKVWNLDSNGQLVKTLKEEEPIKIMKSKNHILFMYNE